MSLEIRKGAIVLVLNQKIVPFDRRVCLVVEMDPILDGWFKVIDWEGEEHIVPERELLILGQSRANTRNTKEAAVSCYEQVIATLAAVCDVVNSECVY